MDEIDIYPQVAEICERLGIKPEHVKRLTLEPFSAVALLYDTRQEDGAKYVQPGSNHAALYERKFKVRL